VTFLFYHGSATVGLVLIMQQTRWQRGTSLWTSLKVITAHQTGWRTIGSLHVYTI